MCNAYFVLLHCSTLTKKYLLDFYSEKDVKDISRLIEKEAIKL